MLCRIADLLIDVPEAGGMAPRCREYLSEEMFSADIIICTEHYRYEKFNSVLSDETIAYIESGRQFAFSLPLHQGLYLHASAVAVNGRAYLFSGTSGTGKSTHTQLWKQLLGDKACVFNDDKPALRYINGTWYAYGTPWCGKDGINQNIKVPLAGICFLKQAEHNKIQPLDTEEALKRILKQTTRSYSKKEHLLLVLENLDKLIRRIPIYELENRPELEAAQLSYETMYRAAMEKGL